MATESSRQQHSGADACGSRVSAKGAVRPKVSAFLPLAEMLLIPSLILSVTISNNPTWALGPILGHLLGWVALVSASLIVMSRFRGKLWPLILIALVLTAKGLQIAIDPGGEGAWFTYYTILYGCLLCSAGAVMLSCRLKLVYKQLYIICLLNIILMFLQVAGIADWSQFAATHQDIDNPTYHVAFFNTTDDFDTSQRRPSGFTYSNQYLSIIALFALAVHFSRKRRGLAAGTFVVCVMMVLSMAKLVFAGFILMSLLVLISGNSYQRKTVLKGIAITVLLVYLYAILFPGILETNMAADQLIFSFSTRISSILLQYGAVDAYTMMNDFARETREGGGVNIKVLQVQSARDMEQENISGYASLITILPYLLAALAVLMPFYIRGFFKMRALLPDLTTLPAMCMILAAIIPAAGPLWGSQLYLFMLGFALLPLFVLVQKQAFKRIEKAKGILRTEVA